MAKSKIASKTMVKWLTISAVMLGAFYTLFVILLWANRKTITIAAPPDRAVYDVSQTPTSESDAEGKFCGGIAGLPCPTGYSCNITSTYPDAGGSCVKQAH